MSSANNIKGICLLALGRLSITFLWPFDCNKQGSLMTPRCLFFCQSSGKGVVEHTRISNYFCHKIIMIITDLEWCELLSKKMSKWSFQAAWGVWRPRDFHKHFGCHTNSSKSLSCITRNPMSIKILSQQNKIFPDTVQRRVSLVLLRWSVLFLSHWRLPVSSCSVGCSVCRNQCVMCGACLIRGMSSSQ